jgi:hypothetical protein
MRDPDERHEPEERFMPLFEVLNWTAALLDPNSSLHGVLSVDNTL